jgi:hypothetical protein
MKGAGQDEGRDKQGAGDPGACGNHPGSGHYATGGRPGRYAAGPGPGPYRPQDRHGHDQRGSSDPGGRPTDNQHAGNQAVNDGPDGTAGNLPEEDARTIPGAARRGALNTTSGTRGQPGPSGTPGYQDPPGAPGLPGLSALRDLSGLRGPSGAHGAPDPGGNMGGPGLPGGPGGRGPGTGGPGPYGPEGEEPDPDDHAGLAADELALSRLLKQSVREVEPRRGSLDHLRRAVPARRARKRRAAVGIAAAAVLVCIGVPALIHVSQSGGFGADRTSVAGHGEQPHGDTGQGKSTDGGRQGTGQPSGPGDSAGKDGRRGTGESAGTGDGASSGPGPGHTLAATAPACAASALGNAQASVDPPDADGKVYGSFRVANISHSDCTVDGVGTVNTVAQGAADPAKINVVDHTVGDPATRLPSPAQDPAQLVLQPGMAYEVQFAWVPSESCNTDSGTPSPDPTSTEGVDRSGQSGLSTQHNGNDGAPADGSVAVSHRAEPGGPMAATTIPNACAGTLYRTGLLPTS